MGSQSMQYGAKIPLWRSPQRNNFFSPDHTETSKIQNTKTAAYQPSKNDWIRPFFGVFRFAREKSFVTVAFDHTVGFHLVATN